MATVKEWVRKYEKDIQSAKDNSLNKKKLKECHLVAESIIKAVLTKEEVNFERVLAVSDDEEIDFGRPYLENVTVNGKVIENGKNKKIVVFKYKPKTRSRRKMGHRQPYTKVLIENIER